MLTWRGASEAQTLELLQNVFENVLRSDREERSAIMLGALGLQMLQSLAGKLDGVLPRLMQLMVGKARCCEMHALRGQLLVVITRCALLQLCWHALHRL